MKADEGVPEPLKENLPFGVRSYDFPDSDR